VRSPPKEETRIPDDGKSIPRRMIEQVYNRGRLDVVDELIAPEYIGHDPALPQDIVGPPGEKQIVAGYRAAFPDLVITIEDQIAEGDRVVTRWTARGTHTGDLWGIAATAREVTVTGTSVDRIKGGRIAESWSNWDTIGLMQQLGVIPVLAQF
jgi:steroid delta-isomerase-like uncharacterized protein